jgi:dihydrofolate reductase
MMRKLSVFNNVTLDGYFTDNNGDMSWAHENADDEWNQFTIENAKSSGGGTLLFGRVTYDMMVSFWPTPAAMEQMPDVAKAMNDLPKVVFSRTMDKPAWKNTTLVKDDIAGAVRKMKQEDGNDMVIMGSGTIIAQLAPEDLIDQYQIIVHPLALGAGRTIFDGIKKKLPLKLTGTRSFRNGNVLLNFDAGR